MVAVVFGADDVARTRIAAGPSTQVELSYSLRMLLEPPMPCFAGWRRRIRGRLNSRVRELITHAVGSDTLHAREAFPAGLDGVTQGYQRVAIEPFWARINTLVEADRGLRARVLFTGGVEQLLATLHPAVRWQSLRLEMGGAGPVVHLDGRGLLLQPSVFVWRAPVLTQTADGQPMLMYPVSCELTGSAGAAPPDRLDRLIGHSRATMLNVLAESSLTTSELSKATELSLAATSQHATVLRAAGLINTRRLGRSRLHALTPLGIALLTDPAYPSGPLRQVSTQDSA